MGGGEGAGGRRGEKSRCHIQMRCQALLLFGHPRLQRPIQAAILTALSWGRAAIPAGTQEDRHPHKFKGHFGWKMSADATFFQGRQATVGACQTPGCLHVMMGEAGLARWTLSERQWNRRQLGVSEVPASLVTASLIAGVLGSGAAANRQKRGVQWAVGVAVAGGGGGAASRHLWHCAP